MECAYKFRIYPTKEQEEKMQITFRSVRYVYNYYLTYCQYVFENEGRHTNYYDWAGDLTLLKKDDDTLWLKEADSNALQQALRHLDRAYHNFFRRVKKGEKGGFPKPKGGYGRTQSYTTKCLRFNTEKNQITLPKLGDVKCIFSRHVPGRVLSVNVSQTPSGKYFVSLCCTEVTFPALDNTGKVIGIHVGLDPFITTSDGETYNVFSGYTESMEKLAKLQRKLSKKEFRSGRYEKQRIKIAKLHESVANRRNDMLHKLTTSLVRDNDVICVGKVSPKEELANNEKAIQIADAAWGEFIRMLKYKAERYGRTVIEVNLEDIDYVIDDAYSTDVDTANVILAEGLSRIV